MKMFEPLPPSDLLPMALPLMSSAEDSPARTSALQEVEQAWRESDAAYGMNMPELLASLDLTTSSWKMLQPCLVEGLRTFSDRWPRSGMMRSGTAYQLLPLAPLNLGVGVSFTLAARVHDRGELVGVEAEQVDTEALGHQLHKLEPKVFKVPARAGDRQLVVGDNVGAPLRRGKAGKGIVGTDARLSASAALQRASPAPIVLPSSFSRIGLVKPYSRIEALSFSIWSSVWVRLLRA